MFRIIGETNLDFMGAGKIAVVISSLLILAGAVSLIVHGGPRYSIDFTGGRLVDIAFLNETITAGEIRSTLDRIGLSGAEVQTYAASEQTGEHGGVVLRFKEDATIDGQSIDVASPTDAIVAALREVHPTLETDLRREESVGPKIGSELRGRAVQSIGYALVLILVYIAIRFELIYGFGAVVALFHDVFITVGVFSILNLEISLPIVAALLTIAGYSINDTIIVFDRIRERRKSDQRRRIREIFNLSINQTLSRTVVTGMTTIFTALALFLFGGTVIHDFAFAILLGVVIGTYSSIFVASALVYALFNAREKAGKMGKKRTAATPATS